MSCLRRLSRSGCSSYESFEFADERASSAECEIGVDAILDHGEAALLESRDLGLREILISEVRERRTAPESKSIAKKPRSGFRITLCELEPPGVREIIELLEVEISRLERKPIAAPAVCSDPSPRALRSRETWTCRVLSGVARRGARVEVVDDAVDRHGRSSVDEQDGEQRLLLGAEHDGTAVALDFEGTEDPDVHR